MAGGKDIARLQSVPIPRVAGVAAEGARHEFFKLQDEGKTKEADERD
jgi:hypothetical protein